jgi:hypothetical protein
MKHSALTFSRAELIDLCPWIASDGAPDAPAVDGPGDDAKVGRADHGVKAQVINRELISADQPVTEARKAQIIDEALRAEGLNPDVYRSRLSALRPVEHAQYAIKMGGSLTSAEVSFSIDLATGTCVEVGRDLGRKYERKPGHIFGTVDLLHTESSSLDGTMTVVVGDWKVGPMARQEITPARDNKQMALAAYAVKGAYKPKNVRVELRFISADGDLFLDSHEYDDCGIAEIDVWLQELEAKIAAATEPTPGMHCAAKFCPLISVCPAVQRTINEVVAMANRVGQAMPIEPNLMQRDLPLNVTSKDQLVSEEHARLILGRARAVKKLCEQMIKAVQGWTDDAGPIPLGGGKVYGPKDKYTREIKAPTVEEIKIALVKFLPPDEINKLVFATVALGKLGAAIKLRAPMGEGAQAERSALAFLKSSGLIEETRAIEHRDHRPKTGSRKPSEDDDD